MHILLVQSLVSKIEDLVYPLGLAYLAASLMDHGHEVVIFDTNTANNAYQALGNLLSRQHWDAVGLSLRNIDNQQRINLHYYYKTFQEVLRVVEEHRKNAKIIVGGAGFSMFPSEVMGENPAIDFGMVLEAEESLPELLAHLDHPDAVLGVYYRQNGKPVFTGPRALPDFGKLPRPTRALLDMTPYLNNPLSIGVQTKRGCPLTCAYCNYPYLNGSVWRKRDPGDICDEIEELRDRYGVRHIDFADSVFNVPHDYSTRILETMIARDLNVSWTGYVHLRGVTKEYLRLAIRSGCKTMVFSPDAISPGGLKGLKKGIRTEDVEHAMSLSRDPEFKHLTMAFCFFINPPGENLAGWIRTMWVFFLSKIKLGPNAFVNWIRIEPNTEVYRLCVEEHGYVFNTLLPKTTQELGKLFYCEPKLRFLDPPLLFAWRAGRQGKHLLRRLLGKAKGA